LETFRRKQHFINDFQLRIGEELARFDVFERQVSEEFDTLLQKVTAKKAAALAELITAKSQLAAQLSEIQQTIEAKRYAEAPEITTALDDTIVNGYLSTATISVQMFTGRLELQGVEKMLEKAFAVEVLRGILEQELGQDIPVLKGNSLRLFDRKTLQMTTQVLDQTTRFDEATAYCYIGPTTLLAVGGMYHNEVYEVNESGKVGRAPNMTTIRGWVGLINYRHFVYVIGGYNSSQYLSTGEKYGIALKSWTPVRNPLHTAKLCCSICEHTSGLYVSGYVNGGSSIEHFNPTEETFRLLRSDSIAYVSLLCCVGDELYHVRQNQMEVASLSNGPAVTFTVKATFPQIGNGHYWLCCPLKMIGGELVSVINPANTPVGLFCWKPTQGQFTQVANFTY